MFPNASPRCPYCEYDLSHEGTTWSEIGTRVITCVECGREIRWEYQLPVVERERPVAPRRSGKVPGAITMVLFALILLGIVLPLTGVLFWLLLRGLGVF